MVAALDGRVEVVDRLLAAGADVNARDKVSGQISGCGMEAWLRCDCVSLDPLH